MKYLNTHLKVLYGENHIVCPLLLMYLIINIFAISKLFDIISEDNG